MQLETANSAATKRGFMSINEFCNDYCVSRGHAYNLLRAKEIEGVKLGRVTRLTRESVDRWAESLPRFHAA